jgi:predicted transcriptional regulator
MKGEIVTARIDKGLLKRLRSLANLERRTISFTVADAIREFVERREKKASAA